MTTEVENLAAQYKLNVGQMSERMKAEMERSLWNLCPPSERKTTNRLAWLYKLLGASRFAMHARVAVLYLGDDAEPIWDRLDKKQMTHATAESLAREARGLIELQKISAKVAVGEVLKQYDALPYVAFVDGIPVRKKSFSRLNPKANPVPAAVSIVEVESEKNVFAGMRTLTTKYLDEKLKGIEAGAAAIIRKEFDRDLKILLEDFRRKVANVQRREANTLEVMTVAIDREAVREACQTLVVDPPTYGKPIDLEKARKMKKKLVQQYHPDTHGGDEATRPLYEGVIKAYETLEKYAEKFNAPSGEDKNADRNRNESGATHG